MSIQNQWKTIEKEIEAIERERAKEPGKRMGNCEACDLYTVVVSEVGLCGVCCFGEAECVNGNW